MVKIICLLILVLEAIGLSISIRERGWKIFAFYTQLSNIIAAVSALLVIILGETDFTVLLRYLSSCMLLMTFIVTTCVLVPMGGDAKQLLFSANGLYHHLLVPIISVASSTRKVIQIRTDIGEWLADDAGRAVAWNESRNIEKFRPLLHMFCRLTKKHAWMLVRACFFKAGVEKS